MTASAGVDALTRSSNFSVLICSYNLTVFLPFGQAAFQVVCEALLHDKGKNASLQRLPSIWLGQLIHQLNGAEQEVR